MIPRWCVNGQDQRQQKFSGVLLRNVGCLCCRNPNSLHACPQPSTLSVSTDLAMRTTPSSGSFCSVAPHRVSNRLNKYCAILPHPTSDCTTCALTMRFQGRAKRTRERDFQMSDFCCRRICILQPSHLEVFFRLRQLRNIKSNTNGKRKIRLVRSCSAAGRW